MVTQDTFLFYDTIAANIRFAKPEATLKEVEEVICILFIYAEHPSLALSIIHNI